MDLEYGNLMNPTLLSKVLVLLTFIYYVIITFAHHINVYFPAPCSDQEDLECFEPDVQYADIHEDEGGLLYNDKGVQIYYCIRYWLLI